MNDNRLADRILLAEAMGWKWKRKPESWSYSHVYPEMGDWTDPDGTVQNINPCGCQVPPPFNPLVYANDDYAVLEWMRGDEDDPDTERWESFKDYFRLVTVDWNIWNYKVGDYANAALKVIKQ